MSKKRRSNSDYEVGYCKPPQDTRWQPGESGNPKGKPKAPDNFQSIFEDVFFSSETATINGKKRTIPALYAIFMRLKKSAFESDPKAIKQILDYGLKLGIRLTPESSGCEKCKNRPVGAVVVPAGVPAEMWEELYGEKAKGTYRPAMDKE